MPELPEVETIKNDLQKVILGKKITNIEIRGGKTVNPVINFEFLNGVKNKPEVFFKILKNNFFSGISRIGKLLIFEIAGGKNFLLIHLKMTGQLIFLGKGKMVAGGHETGGEKELPNKHTRIIFSFGDKEKLFFNDLRKFGYAKIVDAPELGKIREKYGIEPLTKNFTFKAFSKAIKGKNASIKAILLNQGVVAGIGNIYADEALFEAKIRPERRANALSESEKRVLFQSINKIIKIAIKSRGTTFSSYVDANGQKGGFTKLLKVYGREGEKCRRCRGIIKKTKVAGRGTRYCEKCQK